MKGAATTCACTGSILQRRREGGHAPAVWRIRAADFLSIIEEWSKRTETGDRAEIADLPEDLPFWGEIAATSENCIGTECPRYTDCFVTRMRSRAAESNLVVVNHHLLCADAAVRQSAYGEVIPECSYAVVDEAHQLEDVATQYFGVSVSTYRFDELSRDGERLISTGVAGEKAPELREMLDRAKDRAHEFFRNVASGIPSRAQQPSENRVRVTAKTLEPFYEDAALVMSALDMIEATAALIKPAPPEPDKPQDAAKMDLAGLSHRAGELRDELRFILRANEPDYVYFLETRGRGLFLRAAPIDVSTILRDVLFDRMRATVLTSATLTVEGTFDFVRSRLGLDKSGPRSSSSCPRSSTIAGRRFCTCRGACPIHARWISRRPRRARSSASSKRRRDGPSSSSPATRHCARSSRSPRSNCRTRFSCRAPRRGRRCCEQFRTTPNAVLLATSSFWQGVDVMGDALSCVIIDKLPFASPGDPITAARIEAIADRGGQPFGEYQVPLAILTLLQGLGRLIRHRDDRGVLAVLDPRLQTMGYGRRFLASLPPPASHAKSPISNGFLPGHRGFGLSCKLFSDFLSIQELAVGMPNGRTAEITCGG